MNVEQLLIKIETSIIELANDQIFINKRSRV